MPGLMKELLWHVHCFSFMAFVKHVVQGQAGISFPHTCPEGHRSCRHHGDTVHLVNLSTVESLNSYL